MFKKHCIAIFIFSILFLLLGNTTYAEISEIRISGKDRFETAVEISKTGFSKADTVILSTAYNFPDALAGGSLAFKNNAPILLTSKDSLGKATKNEILRLEAKRAIILGSTGVVSQKVVDELRYIGVSVERIGGSDRFETAALIANKLNKTNTAIVAYGYNFPDVLAIAPYAAKNGYPILLVGKDSIPESTKKQLKNIKNTIIVGGNAIISKNVESQLPNPKRISGKDRFQTNAKILQELQKDTFTSYVSTGYNFADALTGSVLAAKNNAAMLLVQSNELPAPIHYVLNEKKFSEAIPLGGTAVVSNNVIEEITDLIKNDSRERALPIQGGTYTSHLISTDDQDYYKLQVNKPGTVTISMDRTETADWIINLYTKEGKQIGYSEVETGKGKFSIDFGVPKGEFYLKISDDLGSYDSADDNERYTFSVKLDDKNSAEQELNESIATASPINVNTAVTGAIQAKDSVDDVDYYQFTLNQAGNAQIQFTRSPDADWIVYVFDKNGVQYGYSEVESGTGTFNIDFGLPAGQFYVKVVDDTGSYDTNDQNKNYSFTIKYTESTRYEKEFNDEMKTASLVAMDGKSYQGTLQARSSSSDSDFYKFNVANPGNVTIKMNETKTDDWIVYVYDSEGTVLGYTEIESGSETRNLMFGLPKGTYYLKIIDDTGSYDTDDTFDPYAFSVSYEQNNYYEKEYNGKFYNATPVEFGKKYTGSIQAMYSGVDEDYYVVNLTHGGILSVVMQQAEYDDWSYVIYDGNLKSVGSDEVETGFSTYKKEFTLAAGKYYIKFTDDTGSYDYDDSFDPYTFQILLQK